MQKNLGRVWGDKTVTFTPTQRLAPLPALGLMLSSLGRQAWPTSPCLEPGMCVPEPDTTGSPCSQICNVFFSHFLSQKVSDSDGPFVTGGARPGQAEV